MGIKSHLDTAVITSSEFTTKATTEQQRIHYAEESNLTAVKSGKAQGKAATQQFAQYKSFLSGDAGRIGSLGKAFAAVDKTIAQQIQQHL